jgi:hypothetical protein
MNRDKMNSLDPATVSVEALNLLDCVSDSEKEVQAVALAVTLLAYARRHCVEVGDVFVVANNMLADQQTKSPHFIALQNYIRHEL